MPNNDHIPRLRRIQIPPYLSSHNHLRFIYFISDIPMTSSASRHRRSSMRFQRK